MAPTSQEPRLGAEAQKKALLQFLDTNDKATTDVAIKAQIKTLRTEIESKKPEDFTDDYLHNGNNSLTARMHAVANGISTATQKDITTIRLEIENLTNIEIQKEVQKLSAKILDPVFLKTKFFPILQEVKQEDGFGPFSLVTSVLFDALENQGVLVMFSGGAIQFVSKDPSNSTANDTAANMKSMSDKFVPLDDWRQAMVFRSTSFTNYANSITENGAVRPGKTTKYDGYNEYLKEKYRASGQLSEVTSMVDELKHESDPTKFAAIANKYQQKTNQITPADLSFIVSFAQNGGGFAGNDAKTPVEHRAQLDDAYQKQMPAVSTATTKGIPTNMTDWRNRSADIIEHPISGVANIITGGLGNIESPALKAFMYLALAFGLITNLGKVALLTVAGGVVEATGLGGYLAGKLRTEAGMGTGGATNPGALAAQNAATRAAEEERAKKWQPILDPVSREAHNNPANLSVASMLRSDDQFKAIPVVDFAEFPDKFGLKEETVTINKKSEKRFKATNPFDATDAKKIQDFLRARMQQPIVKRNEQGEPVMDAAGKPQTESFDTFYSTKGAYLNQYMAEVVIQKATTVRSFFDKHPGRRAMTIHQLLDEQEWRFDETPVEAALDHWYTSPLPDPTEGYSTLYLVSRMMANGMLSPEAKGKLFEGWKVGDKFEWKRVMTQGWTTKGVLLGAPVNAVASAANATAWAARHAGTLATWTAGKVGLGGMAENMRNVRDMMAMGIHTEYVQLTSLLKHSAQLMADEKKLINARLDTLAELVQHMDAQERYMKANGGARDATIDGQIVNDMREIERTFGETPQAIAARRGIPLFGDAMTQEEGRIVTEETRLRNISSTDTNLDATKLGQMKAGDTLKLNGAGATQYHLEVVSVPPTTPTHTFNVLMADGVTPLTAHGAPMVGVPVQFSASGVEIVGVVPPAPPPGKLARAWNWTKSKVGRGSAAPTVSSPTNFALAGVSSIEATNGNIDHLRTAYNALETAHQASNQIIVNEEARIGRINGTAGTVSDLQAGMGSLVADSVGGVADGDTIRFYDETNHKLIGQARVVSNVGGTITVEYTPAGAAAPDATHRTLSITTEGRINIAGHTEALAKATKFHAVPNMQRVAGAYAATVGGTRALEQLHAAKEAYNTSLTAYDPTAQSNLPLDQTDLERRSARALEDEPKARKAIIDAHEAILVQKQTEMQSMLADLDKQMQAKKTSGSTDSSPEIKAIRAQAEAVRNTYNNELFNASLTMTQEMAILARSNPDLYKTLNGPVATSIKALNTFEGKIAGSKYAKFAVPSFMAITTAHAVYSLYEESDGIVSEQTLGDGAELALAFTKAGPLFDLTAGVRGYSLGGRELSGQEQRMRLFFGATGLFTLAGGRFLANKSYIPGLKLGEGKGLAMGSQGYQALMLSVNSARIAQTFVGHAALGITFANVVAEVSQGTMAGQPFTAAIDGNLR